MQLPDELELELPPRYEIGEKVKTRKLIRNDGTYPGKDIGATLAKKGEEGYVISVGTFLQNAYIYAVHFVASGNIVGCRGRELDWVEDDEDLETANTELEVS